MLSEGRRWALDAERRLRKANERRDRLESAHGGMLNLGDCAERFDLRMSQQRRIIEDWHRVTADAVDQRDQLLARAIFERLFPDGFHLGRVPADTRSLAATVVETRVAEHVLHPKLEQQPIPFLGVAAAQDEIEWAVLRLVTVFGRH